MDDNCKPRHVTEFFPLAQPREKQLRAMDFLQTMLDKGVTDIVVAAPTGSGKSALAAALAMWAAQPSVQIPNVTPGAYVLCTQRLLQDQYDREKDQYLPHLRDCVSLKSSANYTCPYMGTCQVGGASKPPCASIMDKDCVYQRQKASFLDSRMAVTNYPYLFTERLHLKALPTRRMLIADECHNIENQILRFIEVCVGPVEIEKFTPALHFVPDLPTHAIFDRWIEADYLPRLLARLEAFDEDVEPERKRELDELTSFISRLKKSRESWTANPDNWVYWQEMDKEGRRVSMAKPIQAAPFVPEMLTTLGCTRVYLSAYPGDKQVFCRSLGLDPEATALLRLGSTFPLANRPVYLLPMGKMAKTHLPTTLPSVMRGLQELFTLYSNTKGLVHCGTYAIGEAVSEHFKDHPRLLFSADPSDREDLYRQHVDSSEPTILMGPAFYEGFDFAGDLARWQAILKMQYPYLGDPQVQAKKEFDPEWYSQQAVSCLIQACGRIVRYDQDRGDTYILDADFDGLYSRHRTMFPKWWTEAVHWNK